MIHGDEESGQSFFTNLTKFKNEVVSVSSLLMAENDRLTEIRDSLQSKVGALRELTESRRESGRIDDAG